MIDRSSRDSIGNFKSDGLMPPVLLQNNTKELNDFIDSEVEKGYERAYIFGNGKGLNNVTEEEISIINDNDKFVSIGINRTFWKFYTDYLLFADHNTLNVIMKHIFSLKRNLNIISIRSFNYSPPISPKFVDSLNGEFPDHKEYGLFFNSNSLPSAIHLATILNVKEIVLSGVDYDGREYFYPHHLSIIPRTTARMKDPDRPYDLSYDKNSGFKAFRKKGDEMNTYNAVVESIKMSNKEGVEFYYTDKSVFLEYISSKLNINKTERLIWQ